MNISYNWLKDLIDIGQSVEEIAQKLTNVGLAVEGIHAHGDDHVLDIDMTSNRPDCLSHLGVAREIAVIADRGLRIADSHNVQDPGPKDQGLVTIQDSDLCNRFTARIIRNVKVGPSPQWLVDRLEAIGERSINNVADITNYVMHELGQPMHSFDLDKLTGGRIVVRRARPGETITTLDEVDRKLDDSMVAVCDAEKPVAVGGVMGGLDSSITENTVNVLLEVAYFKRESVRSTSRKLGLATEASYRFERGVDIERLTAASNRATELICEYAAGEADLFIDVYPTKFASNEIISTDISAAVERLTGLKVEEKECLRILNALGIKSPAATTFLSPSWRHDLAIEEDLVEEVARHAGYDHIATELPPAFGAGEYQDSEVREKLLRQTLADMGFDEALSYSFIDTRFDDMFETVPGVLDDTASEKYVTLKDAVIEGALRMRPSMMPGLLDAVRVNFNHQRRDLRLFELGKVFAARSGEDGLPNEQEVFALVMTGGEMHHDRAMPAREMDFYDAKGAVEAAFHAAGVDDVVFSAAEIKHLRAGQTASISIGGKGVGYVGALADDIAGTYKFRQPVYLAEVNLQSVLAAPPAPVAYRPLARYPGVVRDVSFVVKRDIAFAAIRDAIVQQDYELCRNVLFVDIYEGKGLAPDERSMTIRLEYRSDERTLVEDEVERLHQQIVSQIEQNLGINPRF